MHGLIPRPIHFGQSVDYQLPANRAKDQQQEHLISGGPKNHVASCYHHHHHWNNLYTIAIVIHKLHGTLSDTKDPDSSNCNPRFAMVDKSLCSLSPGVLHSLNKIGNELVIRFAGEAFHSINAFLFALQRTARDKHIQCGKR